MLSQEVNAPKKNVIFLIRKIIKNEKGNLLVLGCISLNIFLLILSFVLNLGTSYAQKNHLQKTALLASQAGGSAILDNLYNIAQNNSKKSNKPDPSENIFFHIYPKNEEDISKRIKNKEFDKFIIEKIIQNSPEVNKGNILINHHFSKDRLRIEVTLRAENPSIIKSFSKNNTSDLIVTANTIIPLR